VKTTSRRKPRKWEAMSTTKIRIGLGKWQCVHYNLPGFEEVWTHQQEEDQEDDDMNIIVFLAMKSCEHSSSKK
jgi:hypothetical protein